MAIRLSDLLGPRTVELGYGVTVTLRPVGYADLKAAEAAALRGARTRLSALREAGDLVAGGVEAAERFEADVAGLAEELMLDELVARHAASWAGVLDVDGEREAPLTRETWIKFRRGLPYLADRLRLAFREPAGLVVSEGEPSAP